MALLIAPSGSARQVRPAQGTCFSSEELRNLVDEWLACIRLPHGRLMWISGEGRQRDLPCNPLATILARSRLQPGDVIIGPALVTTRREAEGIIPACQRCHLLP